MEKKSVLAIGIDPAVTDFAKFPGFTVQQFRQFIDAQIDRVRSCGFDVNSCLIDMGESAEATTAAALKSKRWDCVVIGAGLRQPPELLLLFERIVNLVHALAPTALICFNTRPDDTAEAVERCLKG
jgi:hypothetical protein